MKKSTKAIAKMKKKGFTFINFQFKLNRRCIDCETFLNKSP